jgi:hypothetical protein
MSHPRQKILQARKGGRVSYSSQITKGIEQAQRPGYLTREDLEAIQEIKDIKHELLQYHASMIDEEALKKDLHQIHLMLTRINNSIQRLSARVETIENTI